MEIKEIVEKMCDKYCKYPELIDEMEILVNICDHCPLNDLEDKYEYLEGEDE